MVDEDQEVSTAYCWSSSSNRVLKCDVINSQTFPVEALSLMRYTQLL